MSDLHASTHDATAAATARTATAPRLDLYVFIHKALRQFMGHTLATLGRMDVDDAEERSVALDGTDALLAQMRRHLQHENDFLHTAIEARRPGGARLTAEDHGQHEEAIANLEDESRALRDARPEQRPALALRLYRHLAEFVGENLVHMQIEETQNNAALWALYSDAELAEIHGRLMACIGPAEMALTARWMAAALNDQELALLYGDIQHSAPAPAFDALCSIARSQLDDRRWARLARALGLPPVPGLVTV